MDIISRSMMARLQKSHLCLGFISFPTRQWQQLNIFDGWLSLHSLASRLYRLMVMMKHYASLMKMSQHPIIKQYLPLVLSAKSYFSIQLARLPTNPAKSSSSLPLFRSVRSTYSDNWMPKTLHGQQQTSSIWPEEMRRREGRRTDSLQKRLLSQRSYKVSQVLFQIFRLYLNSSALMILQTSARTNYFVWVRELYAQKHSSTWPSLLPSRSAYRVLAYFSLWSSLSCNAKMGIANSPTTQISVILLLKLSSSPTWLTSFSTSSMYLTRVRVSSLTSRVAMLLLEGISSMSANLSKMGQGTLMSGNLSSV